MILVTIPTLKDKYEISPLLVTIEGFSYPNPVFASCKKQSAAKNRNDCIRMALASPGVAQVVMVDDDIRGFYPGWIKALVAPLEDKNVIAVSARLMNKEGGYGLMMGMEDKNQPEGFVEVGIMPSACIAFNLSEAMLFEERFIHSGYEDLYWCWCQKQTHPEMEFIVNNNCKLIHLNERKEQDAEAMAKNKSIYEELTKGSK